MAITEPYDLLADWPGWQTAFEPVDTADISRQKNGVTRTRLGPMPIWRMALTTRSLPPNQLDRVKARVQRLAGLQTVILGYSLSRWFPIAYPHGTWPTGATFTGKTANLQTVSADNRSARVNQLPSGFRLQDGDMIQVGDADLHTVQESVVASAAGLTPAFEIYPPFWPGVIAGRAVSVFKPACRMRIVVGTVAAPINPATGWGTVSFEAMEARDA